MTTFGNMKHGGTVEATPGTFRHTLLVGHADWQEVDLELDDVWPVDAPVDTAWLAPAAGIAPAAPGTLVLVNMDPPA
jgi:hypothetical protein